MEDVQIMEYLWSGRYDDVKGYAKLVLLRVHNKILKLRNRIQIMNGILPAVLFPNDVTMGLDSDTIEITALEQFNKYDFDVLLQRIE